MVLVKCLCSLIVIVLMCAKSVSTGVALGASNVGDVNLSDNLVPFNSNRSIENTTEETKGNHFNDASTGRAKLRKKGKHLVQMLIQAKMVAAAIFVPGIIALSLFASWKGAFFSIVASIVAIFALLRPHGCGGREYTHVDHRTSDRKTWPVESPPLQRVRINEFGDHKALLHVFHHGGQKEDHHHDHHVWYHETEPQYNNDMVEEHSYTSDPYQGWNSR